MLELRSFRARMGLQQSCHAGGLGHLVRRGYRAMTNGQVVQKIYKLGVKNKEWPGRCRATITNEEDSERA